MMTLYYKAHRVNMMTKGEGGSKLLEKLVTSYQKNPKIINFSLISAILTHTNKSMKIPDC